MSGRVKLLVRLEEAAAGEDVGAPQRTQSRLGRLTPVAAADSGWREFETSIQAQTLPSAVIWARKERESEEWPEPGEPTISVMAPMGMPPERSWSIEAMPVETTGRTGRGARVSAEGMRWARADSIWARSCWEERARAVAAGDMLWRDRT